MKRTQVKRFQVVFVWIPSVNSFLCARKTWATWSWSSTKRPRRRRDTGDMQRQRNSADSCEHVVNMCENMWNILKCCINICICNHLCCVAAMDIRVYVSRQNVGILSCACNTNARLHVPNMGSRILLCWSQKPWPRWIGQLWSVVDNPSAVTKCYCVLYIILYIHLYYIYIYIYMCWDESHVVCT